MTDHATKVSPSPVQNTKPLPAVVWACLLLSLVVFFAHTAPGSVCDQSNFALVESLLEKGSFRIEESSPYFNRWDMAFYQGHFYCGKQPLLALSSVAVLFPVHLFLRFDTEAGRAVLYYLAVLIGNAGALLLLLAFLRRAFVLVGVLDKRCDWVLAYIFLGSIILPFSGTYNTGLMEAALLTGAFTCLLDYRVSHRESSPVICGLLLGASALLHLFSGVIFMGLTAVYFLFSRVKDLFRFLMLACFMVLIGIGINQIEHGNPKPFYMMTETYIYEKSPRLFIPKLSNLSEKQLTQRLDELGLPSWQKIVTLDAYWKYKKSVSNIFEFARENLVTRDFLNLTPIFFAGILSILQLFFDKAFRFKREALWVLMGTVAAYVGLLVTRSDAGWSFGNRYLIPVIPLITFFTVFYFKEERNMRFFKLTFWVAFAMMVPGIIQAWRPPSPVFSKWNLWANVVILGTHFLSYGISGISSGIRAVDDFFARYPWAGAILVAALFRIQISLFAGQVFF